MVSWSAVAMTSAGASSEIWETRSEESAKENFTVGDPGSALSNSSAMSSNTSVKEAAAKTVISVDSEESACAPPPDEQALRVSAATMQTPVNAASTPPLNPQMRIYVDF